MVAEETILWQCVQITLIHHFTGKRNLKRFSQTCFWKQSNVIRSFFWKNKITIAVASLTWNVLPEICSLADILFTWNEIRTGKLTSEFPTVEVIRVLASLNAHNKNKPSVLHSTIYSRTKNSGVYRINRLSPYMVGTWTKQDTPQICASYA